MNPEPIRAFTHCSFLNRCRRLKGPDPASNSGSDVNKHVYKFSFEYTPGAGR